MASKPKLTHFLSVPLVTEVSRVQLNHSLEQFRSRFLQASAGQFDPDRLGRAIRPVSTIHLTLGVMSLTTDEQIEGACSLLQELDLSQMLVRASEAAVSSVVTMHDTQPSPLTVSLRSLATFARGKRSPVFFAEPLDTTSRLQPFCNDLRKRFSDAGYVIAQESDLKLHATVLNTRYAPSHGHRGKHRQTVQIPSDGLLRAFSDFVWMEDVQLERVAVCKMGAEKIQDDSGAMIDERYVEVSAAELPR